jgi:hypothetical protein
VTPAPNRRWFRVPEALQGRVLIVSVLAFYFLPWCPFWIAAFYVEAAWLKLLLGTIGCIGPVLQAVLLACLVQVD